MPSLLQDPPPYALAPTPVKDPQDASLGTLQARRGRIVSLEGAKEGRALDKGMVLRL